MSLDDAPTTTLPSLDVGKCVESLLEIYTPVVLVVVGRTPVGRYVGMSHVPASLELAGHGDASFAMGLVSQTLCLLFVLYLLESIAVYDTRQKEGMMRIYNVRIFFLGRVTTLLVGSIIATIRA